MKLKKITKSLLLMIVVLTVVFSVQGIGAYLIDGSSKIDSFEFDLGPQITTLNYSVYNTKTDEIIGEIPIKLINDNGEVVATSVSDENGNGIFEDINTGTYTVVSDIGQITIDGEEASIVLEMENQPVNLGLTTPSNTLVKGLSFYQAIPDPLSITEIQFIQDAASANIDVLNLPDNAYDVSEAQDGSVMAYVEGTKLYVVSAYGGPIYANPNADRMFQSMYALKTININDLDCSNVVTAYNWFYSCSKLTTVTLPANMTIIDDNAFAKCTELVTINIPATVEKIGNDAFSGCYKLANLTFEEDSQLKTIGDEAFLNCRALTTVDLSQSIVSIGKKAFNACSVLQNVYLADNLTYIGDTAFRGTALTSIIIPNGVSEIRLETFYGCTKLTSIILPDTITDIGYSAFYNCYGLRNLNFTGTEEQWNAITKGNNWNYNANNFVVNYNYVS